MGSEAAESTAGLPTEGWTVVEAPRLGVALRVPPPLRLLTQTGDRLVIGAGTPDDALRVAVVRRPGRESAAYGIRQSSREWGTTWGDELAALGRRERWRQVTTADEPDHRVAGYLGRLGVARYTEGGGGRARVAYLWVGQIGTDRVAIAARDDAARADDLRATMLAILDMMSFTAGAMRRWFGGRGGTAWRHPLAIIGYLVLGFIIYLALNSTSAPRPPARGALFVTPPAVVASRAAGHAPFAQLTRAEWAALRPDERLAYEAEALRAMGCALSERDAVLLSAAVDLDLSTPTTPLSPYQTFVVHAAKVC